MIKKKGEEESRQTNRPVALVIDKAPAGPSRPSGRGIRNKLNSDTVFGYGHGVIQAKSKNRNIWLQIRGEGRESCHPNEEQAIPEDGLLSSIHRGGFQNNICPFTTTCLPLCCRVPVSHIFMIWNKKKELVGADRLSFRLRYVEFRFENKATVFWCWMVQTND